MTEDKRLKEIRALYKDESFVFDFDEGVTHEFVGDLLSEIDTLKAENKELEKRLKRISEMNRTHAKIVNKKYLQDAELDALEAKIKKLEAEKAGKKEIDAVNDRLIDQLNENHRRLENLNSILEAENKELKEHNDDMIEALEAAEVIKKADDKSFSMVNERALSLEAENKELKEQRDIYEEAADKADSDHSRVIKQCESAINQTQRFAAKIKSLEAKLKKTEEELDISLRESH